MSTAPECRFLKICMMGSKTDMAFPQTLGSPHICRMFFKNAPGEGGWLKCQQNLEQSKSALWGCLVTKVQAQQDRRLEKSDSSSGGERKTMGRTEELEKSLRRRSKHKIGWKSRWRKSGGERGKQAGGRKQRKLGRERKGEQRGG